MFALAARIAGWLHRNDDPRRKFRREVFIALRRARAEQRRSKWLRLIRR
ncbi:MAG TPA: hypothetical protein VE091_10650 [Gemmatimonadales bacterium]|nr:hypothetical protein [Gemmatimonadales bacterium]